MDSFDQAGMMEVFTGTMHITPGIDNGVRSEIKSVGMYGYNSDGTNVSIADASGKTVSLREMLIKDASEEDIDKFELLLKLKGLHPKDNLEFSGFKGVVVPGTKGRQLKVTGLAHSSDGLGPGKLNVQVEGSAVLDKSNKMYIRSDFHIFIAREDLKNFQPELLEIFVFTVGDEEVPLSELEDENFVLSIAKISFVGAAMTGMF